LLREEGVDVYQTVLRDPGRFGNYGVPDPADRAALVEGLRGRDVWGVAHGSLLVNLASPEGRIRNSSVSSLLADLKVAAEIGLDAVCFHAGYAKGHPSADAALTLATRKLGELIGRMPDGPRLLRIYRVRPGPDRAISPDIAAAAERDSGTLVWKFERRRVPQARYYVVFEAKIPTAPYAPSECPSFRSRAVVLPKPQRLR